MGSIEKFLFEFPYADIDLLRQVGDEIKLRFPHLSFASRFINNIISGRYIDEPVQIIRSILRVIIPEEETEKTLITFIYLHPIMGLLIAPIALKDFASEEAFDEFSSIAKHVYLQNFDVICYSINLLMSLKEYAKQANETLRFFAISIGKLADEIAFIAASDDESFKNGLELFKCGVAAADRVSDKEALVLILKGQADLYSIHGDNDMAIKTFREVDQVLDTIRERWVNSFRLKIYTKLIDLLLEQGIAKEAITYIKKLDDLRKKHRLSSAYDDAILLFFYGKAYRLLGDLKKAEKMLRKAYKQSSKFGLPLRKKIIEELIFIYEKMGKKNKIDEFVNEDVKDDERTTMRV